jgi:ADP-dependent NAD(P)H-hydrate dehydratase
MSDILTIDAAWLRGHPLPDPGDEGKHGRGQVLVVGGQPGLAGAVMLAGVAALRAGAGKLQVAVDESAMSAVSVALPEAFVLSSPNSGAALEDPCHERLIKIAAACDAMLLGPGLIDDEQGCAAALLARRERSVVVDAGALCAVPANPLPPGAVLTPNAGEMARLLGVSKDEIDADPLAAGRDAAHRFGAVVAMKGAKTYIVAPDGAAAVYAGGGPGLGVSGSGDVLGGLIAGLLARGAAPFEAAAWGVFVHGSAGFNLAARIGRLGFLAREIADEAPRVLSAF